MPNIPQVKIGSTTYDIKDEVGRGEISDLKSALSDRMQWPLSINAHSESQVKTNVINALQYKTGFYRPNQDEISQAETYKTYSVPVLPGENIKYYLKFNGGSSAGIIAYCRFLDSSGNIIDEKLSSSGINTKDETVTVPADCVMMTLTQEANYFGYIVSADVSVFNYLPTLPSFARDLALQKSRILHSKSTKTGVYFGYQDLNTGATSYTMHVYDVIPGEKIHVLTRWSSGSYANNTNGIRFYSEDGSIFGIVQNDSAGIFTLDTVVEVPYYAATMEVVSDNATIDVTGERNTPYVAVENEVAVWIGDSYTEANSLVSAGYFRQKRFSTLLSRYFGLKEINYAVGGMGYIWGTTTFIQQLENAIKDTSYDHARVSKVFICGGRNDGQVAVSDFDADGYVKAIKTVIQRAKEEYQNADIVLVPMIWDSTLPSGIIYKQYCLICKAAYGEDAVIIPNGYQWLIGYKDYILSDNIHPNVEGHAMIFDHILNALMTGFSYPYPACVKLVPQSNALTDSSFFDITQENGLLRFQAAIILNSDITHGTTLFAFENNDSQNNPVLFTNWGITLKEISNDRDIGMFTVNNTFSDSGYTITVKANGDVKAGTYYEYCFSIPFGLQAYSSNY